MILGRLATAAALLGCAFAQTPLQVNTPNGNTWWVAQSTNVLSWNCQQAPTPAQFTVLIANKNQNILAAPMAIISIENNYECSQLITQNQASQAAALGYTILLADIVNNTNIYATSQEFEIKALGSAYPTTTVLAGSGTSTSTATGASSTTSKSSAEQLVMSFGTAFAAVGAVLGLVVG